MSCPECGGFDTPQGLGTALKPAAEIIVVARKPLAGTVATNVLQYGTGALHIDACRTSMSEADSECDSTRGRWPTNVLLDDTTAADLDEGGASRFFPTFRWEAKAPTAERPKVDGVQHPTVKPLALMRWLVRLVTPYGGTVLDPFAGSGTTVEASLAEGMRCIAIEREDVYLPLIRERIRRVRDVPMDLWGGDAS